MHEIHTRWAADNLGPVTVVDLRPMPRMQAVMVVDRRWVGCGSPRSVEPAEAVRLARAMTLKNAVAGLPYGGGRPGSCWELSGSSGARLWLPHRSLVGVPSR
ncbi:Glu/Leu/Phe/Val dehydrogenase dimerization domain-containing protein [Nonomuraea sp. NPDC051941]|uniref:Glu/Leu/Phe/Val dehydrogenase dimerization domain-containing protein n=1 Tax=Nonomuraea sp. NPDC051941 TaxID=3364373 RepID=UPI0037CBCCAF